MYLIISWFYSLGKISGIVPEPKLKNWKTAFYGESLPGSLWKNQFFSFSVLLTELFRNISGDKTKKLKNWKTVFLWRISPWMSLEKTVFQFFSFAYGTLPEHFRRQNWKTEKLFFYGESLPGCLWKKQFFSFSVLLTELFRNISGDKTKKLKNWKTVFLWRISSWMSLEKTVFQFFSFAYGSIPEHTTFFSRAVYVIYFYIWARYVTPQTKLTKSRGQNVPETL